MSFLWPKLLVALLVAPVLVAGYVTVQRRRGRRSAELASHGFFPARRLGVRRHLPFVFFLLALVLLLLSLARPQLDIGVPRREGTVILAFDVSNSMNADDLAPTRMEAAKAAARAFVQRQPTSIKLGVVAFSEGGFVTQAPVDDRGLVLAAIERLKPQGGTSLGQGLFTSLSAVAGKPILPAGADIEAALDEIDIGYYRSAAIVLLSDGENTAEPDPVALAELASVAGVRVHTVGLGSPQGTVVEVDGFSLATALDEALLTEIATTTGGTYYHAEDEAELADIYGSIDLEFRAEPEPTEITGLLSAASVALLALGGGLSLLWFGRVV